MKPTLERLETRLTPDARACVAALLPTLLAIPEAELTEVLRVAVQGACQEVLLASAPGGVAQQSNDGGQTWATLPSTLGSYGPALADLAPALAGAFAAGTAFGPTWLSTLPDGTRLLSAHVYSPAEVEAGYWLWTAPAGRDYDSGRRVATPGQFDLWGLQVESVGTRHRVTLGGVLVAYAELPVVQTWEEYEVQPPYLG